MTVRQRLRASTSTLCESLVLLWLGSALLAFAFWTALGARDDATRILVANIGTAVLSGTVAVFAFRAARYFDAATRRAWTWLAVAFLLSCIGDLIWLVLENVLHDDPSVSAADFAYLAFYPAVMLGLLSFPPHLRTPLERAKFTLDVATVMIGAGMSLWYFQLHPIAATTHPSRLELLVALGYPLGDLVLLLGLTAVLLRQILPGMRAALVLLISGLLAQLLGDLNYSQLLIADTYVSGGIADLGWLISYFLVALSAQAHICRARRGDASTTGSGAAGTRPFSPLPYLAIAAGYGLLTWVAVRESGGVITVLIFGSVLLTIVVVARQVISIRESLRLRSEATTRESELRFSSLVQNSSDVILVLDAAGRVTYASPSAERVLGASAAELLGSGLLERVHPDERSRAEQLLRDLTAQHGSTSDALWRFRHQDGRWLHLETTARSLLDDPAVRGIVLNTRDITAHTELELQLRHAQKMEAIGRLAGGVAHDFNNLLTAIQGHTQLASESLDSDLPQQKELAEVLRASGRAAALIRQLLAFSRKQVLKTYVLDANTVIGDLEKMLRRLIGEHIELVTELDPALGRVRADPGQLEQVLANLVVNARDAMPDGGRITIATSNEQPAAALLARAGEPIGNVRFVRITVRDTGCGIDEEVQARIFEPFFTTKPLGQGTGLGLATVYGIVRQSGGLIEVDSRVGSGTAMHVYLPLTSAETAAAPVVSTAAAQRAARNETVLLAEDEAAVRNLAARVLRRAGYQVLEAEHGRGALEIADAHTGPIDVLLTDVVMPGMSGRELAEHFTQLRGPLPILFMSGYAEDEAVTTNGQPGRSFLEKPFTPDALTRKLRDLLDSIGPR